MVFADVFHEPRATKSIHQLFFCTSDIKLDADGLQTLCQVMQDLLACGVDFVDPFSIENNILQVRLV